MRAECGIYFAQKKIFNYKNILLNKFTFYFVFKKNQ